MRKINISALNKSFSDKTVLIDTKLEIEYGEFICLMGSSGCGKTTLINIILGLEKPDSGTLEGIPSKISVVFQEDRLCEDFTALSNVKMVLNESNAKDRAANALTALGIGDALTKPVKQLSGGMKRRVAIARALVAEADMYILDEPFKGLDDDTKDTVIAYVQNALKGKTVLMVTHDISEAEMLGAAVYKMEKYGKITEI